MKRPKRINTLIKHIELKLNANNSGIREIWYCNAGWGIIYFLKPLAWNKSQYRTLKEQKSENVHVVFTYYNTIEECINGEYDRIILKTNNKGGMPDWIK